MWTIVWIDSDGDHFDRFNKEQAAEQVKQLLAKGVAEDDILCFPPDADVSLASLAPADGVAADSR